IWIRLWEKVRPLQRNAVVYIEVAQRGTGTRTRFPYIAGCPAPHVALSLCQLIWHVRVVNKSPNWTNSIHVLGRLQVVEKAGVGNRRDRRDAARAGESVDGFAFAQLASRHEVLPVFGPVRVVGRDAGRQLFSLEPQVNDIPAVGFVGE